MECELISVGTEMLTGAILNTNVQYLSENLSGMGVNVRRHVTVGDNPERLEQAIRDALKRADLVILTGGTGPTQDDLTKETAAACFGKAMVFHPEIAKGLEDYFRARGVEMTENNLSQAMIPEGAEILENPNGTAPGILMEECGRMMVLLPGPPREMKAMFEESVRERIEKKSRACVLSRYYHLTGIGESAAEEALMDLMEGQTNPTLATYCKPDQVLIRVTSSGRNREEAEKFQENYDIIIRQRLGEYLFTESKDTLPEWAGKTLIEEGLTFASAESLTAGMITSTLAEVPGISSVLRGGIVCYENPVKEKVLGVSGETLRRYGAVSEECCREMAVRIRAIMGCDIGVATTGLAGPAGDEGKPVGLVYTGICTKDGVRVEENHFRGTREDIRVRSMNKVFKMFRDYLKERKTV